MDHLCQTLSFPTASKVGTVTVTQSSATILVVLNQTDRWMLISPLKDRNCLDWSLLPCQLLVGSSLGD